MPNGEQKNTRNKTVNMKKRIIIKPPSFHSVPAFWSAAIFVEPA